MGRKKGDAYHLLLIRIRSCSFVDNFFFAGEIARRKKPMSTMPMGPGKRVSKCENKTPLEAIDSAAPVEALGICHGFWEWQKDRDGVQESWRRGLSDVTLRGKNQREGTKRRRPRRRDSVAKKQPQIN
jgi:hypothetical protein